MFQGLCLFKGLRLFQTLEYVTSNYNQNFIKIGTFSDIQTKFVNKLVGVLKKLLKCIDSGG